MTKEDVIGYLEKLTIVELNELIKELEERWGVSASAPVMVGAAAAAPGAAAAAEAEEEKTEFDVILTAVGDKKLQVIKEVRALTGLGLKEAKGLVDAVAGGETKPVKEKVSKEEAEQIKEKLVAAGATVEIK
ncbi:MAG TPA: 50S ribosomal protein L7/L12 [Proteobacteria bacterium]|nr:50S ribosomal protein L7/L12 [Pseudomonadota bacterium]